MPERWIGDEPLEYSTENARKVLSLPWAAHDPRPGMPTWERLQRLNDACDRIDEQVHAARVRMTDACARIGIDPLNFVEDALLFLRSGPDALERELYKQATQMRDAWTFKVQASLSLHNERNALAKHDREAYEPLKPRLDFDPDRPLWSRSDRGHDDAPDAGGSRGFQL
jgi:hypothetical protein